MELIPNKFYAVITGDIIRSSKLHNEEYTRLNRVLKTNAKLWKEKFKKYVPYDMDFFRGDSWQVVISNPVISLRAALFFRLLLNTEMSGIKVDTRVSIGVGSIEFLPEENISSGIGGAFTISGRGLENMSKNQFMSFDIQDEENTKDLMSLQIITVLIDAIATKWTPKQAKAIQGALLGLTQDQIASCWNPPIAQPTVTAHLKRASWDAIKSGIDYFERTLENINK